MSFQLDVMTRVITKLAQETANIPDTTDTIESIRPTITPISDDILDIVKNPYEMSGKAIDDISRMSTGKSLGENISGLNLRDNGFIRAMLNLRGIHPDTGFPR